MTFQGRNVLITGGAGFIGSTLAARLLSLGARITIADSLIPEYGGNMANLEGIRDRIDVNITDVRDPHAMRYLVQGKDILFNLAGQTSHMDSMADPFTDLDINARAQLSILESCRKYNPGIRIVFAGTRQIYGKPDYLPVDEEHPIRPVDINGIHKLAGEWYHLLYNSVYGIQSTVLRLTNTYGPRMRIKDARQTFVGIWIRLLLEGKPIEVWGGEQLRDFTYVDDCVEAMLLAASSPQAVGQVYNLGGDSVVSLRELAELLIQAHGSGEFIIREFPEQRKKIDIGDYYSHDGRIREELGWKPVTPLSQGLEETLKYFAARLDEYL
ncbi:NAD-dependent epimerase/dehydratase family protein [Desulfovibrio sp. OttesenSCG-928-I05]|nr:NAD-dependent epimerase/dehydratase family protein [Desulfovibrio sp. OttesenSCG-928-I05]